MKDLATTSKMGESRPPSYDSRSHEYAMEEMISRKTTPPPFSDDLPPQNQPARRRKKVPLFLLAGLVFLMMAIVILFLSLWVDKLKRRLTIEVQQPDAELQPTVITYIDTTTLSPTTPAMMTVEITATDFNSTRVVTTVLTPSPQPVVVETTIVSIITPNPSRTASKTGSSSPGSITTTSLTTETVSPSPTVTTTSLTTETVTPSSSSSNVEVTVSISTLLSYITNTTLMTTTTSVFNTTVSTRSIPHYNLPNDSNSSTVEASVSTTSSSSTSSPTPSSAEAPTTATATPQTCDPGPLYIGTSNCVVINSCNATLDTEANRCLHMCASWAGVCKNINGLEETQKFCCTSSGCGCAAL